jgi:hypothetical protein
MLAERVIEVVRSLKLTILVIDRQIVALADPVVEGATDSQVRDGRIRDRKSGRIAVRMALANFVRQADSDFIHFSAEYCVQAEHSRRALVGEILCIVERLGNFVLALRAAKTVGVVSREIAPDAEMVGGAELIVVVPKDREQILELIVRTLETSQRRNTIAILQDELPSSSRM